MKPHDMGTLFDSLAATGCPTTVRLGRPFVIAPDGGLTYRMGDLAALVRDAAGWLSAAGIGPGDRVAIAKDNHWDYDLLACAAIRIGATPALLAATLPADAQELMLKRLEPALLVTTAGNLGDARDAGSDLMGMCRRTLALDRPYPGALSIDDVRGHEAPPPQSRHDDAPLIINQTSGTTGVPKLVVHSTGTIINRLARFEATRIPGLSYRRDDTVCSASAFVHGRTFCWTASVFCLEPQQVVIVDDARPEAAVALMQAHPPTVLEGMPSAFVGWQHVTETDEHPFHGVRLYMSTYDAMHPPTVRAFLAASRRRRPLWMQGWGQTETGPLTFRFLTRSALSAAERHPTTRNLGWPLPGKTTLKVVDPHTFRPVPAGRPGVVMARTKARCLGYVGESGRWKDKAYGPWWNTGDIGLRTRTGSIVLLDREVDTVPGMSCLEVEDVVEDRLDEVTECVVLGVPGRLPLPVVVTRDGRLDPLRWQRATADLPPLAQPALLTGEQLPRTATGKVRRLALREQLLGISDTHGSGRWV